MKSEIQHAVYTIYLILKINLKTNPVNPRTCYDVHVAYQGFRLLEVSRDSLARSLMPVIILNTNLNLIRYLSNIIDHYYTIQIT